MGDDLIGAATSSSMQRQIRHIQRINIHPGYNPDTMQNDVAILYVNIALTRICLNLDYCVCRGETGSVKKDCQLYSAAYFHSSNFSSLYIADFNYLFSF